MGSKVSIDLKDEEIREISKETGFTQKQMERLYVRFMQLDKDSKGELTKQDFLRIPELAINPLGERIVQAFMEEEKSQTVNFRQFLKTLARFRPVSVKTKEDLGDGIKVVNSREEKLMFAFRMYDMNGDGQISREEMLEILHMMVGANISEQQLESIANRTIAEGDKDFDGKISFPEYVKVMERIEVEGKMSIRFLN